MSDAVPEDPPRAYGARLTELRSAIAELERRSSRISGLRGLTFLAAAAGVGYGLARGLPPAGWALSGAMGAAFVVLVLVHAVLITRAALLEDRAAVVARSLAHAEERMADLPVRRERSAPPGHPYAGDLDLFGSASIVQLVDTTRTPTGEAILASWLLAGAPAEVVARRQEAARELAGRRALREDLEVLAMEAVGKAARADVLRDPMTTWATSPEPPTPADRALYFAARVAVPLTLLLYLASRLFAPERLGDLSKAWMVPLVAQLVILTALRRFVERRVGVVTSREAPFGRYHKLFERLERETFSAPELSSLVERLRGRSGHDASREMRSLERIVSLADLRKNAVVYIFVNLALLWDVWCAMALERWRARAGARVGAWIEAAGELEALASLGALAYGRPNFTFPEVVEGAPRFEAEALGHPLIPGARRVVNDVSLPSPGSALLVTGSNMSGKSTLLRAIGVNAVLALAGAPVCAKRLRMTTLSVMTSMRISDSLEQGVSHFYAELARLKAIVDAAERGPVLFLLDEILHGTNSRERQIGAKAVVRRLLDNGAIGAVSSHDLGLASMEQESGGRVVNAHFEELVQGDEMTFDYRLKPGVVRSGNALRLMKIVGLDVELAEE